MSESSNLKSQQDVGVKSIENLEEKLRKQIENEIKDKQLRNSMLKKLKKVEQQLGTLANQLSSLSSQTGKITEIDELKKNLNDLTKALSTMANKVNTVDELKQYINTLSEGLSQLAKNFSAVADKVYTIDELKQNYLSAIEELKKNLNEVATKSGAVDELRNAINNITSKIQELEEAKKELDEIKSKVNHKHNWVEIKEGVLQCKDCGEAVTIPPDYTKIKSVFDLFPYMFRPHKHGDKVYDDIFSCPYCRKELTDLFKQRGYAFEIRGDELRLRIPMKKSNK